MYRGIMAVMICLGISLVSIAMVEDTNAYYTRGEIGGYFGSDRLYNSSRSLSGGMGAANLDDDEDIEIVFCDFSGNVVLMDPDQDGSFDAVPIWEQEGPQGTEKGLFDLVVSDVSDQFEGPEIVVGGHSGKLFVLHREDDEWVDDVIFTMPEDSFGEPFRIFDIEIADMDPAPGEEILLGSMVNNQEDPVKDIYPDNYLRYLTRGDTGWEVTEIELPQSVKAIDVGDANSTIPGVEVYVTTSGWEGARTPSYLYQLHDPGTGWVHDQVFKYPHNLIANVRVGDLWSQHPGNELITAGLSGWCRVFWEDGGVFQRDDVFQAQTTSGESSAIEGLAIGDFNPTHAGDEAMVTGYYNEVTQVLDVGGEIVADLAWLTDAPDFRLEFSGVEVHDVIDDHEGKEVLLANLQGWIELLYFEEDGLEVLLPEETLEVESAASATFDIVVIPQGAVEGELTLDITGAMGVELEYDRVLTLDQGTPLEIPVVIDPTSENEREFDLDIDISVSGQTFSGKVPVSISSTGGGFSILVEPSSLTMYDLAGNNMEATVSLIGAEGYDQIDLRTGDVHGLTVMVDTPLKPGKTSNLIVQVQSGFVGSRAVTITGYHNEVPMAQAILNVNVLELSRALEFSLKENENEDRYVNAHLNASAGVRSITVKVYLDEEILYNRVMDIDAGERKDLPPLPLETGDSGEVRVEVMNVGMQEIMTVSLGEVDIAEEDDKENTTAFIIGALFIIGAIIIVVLMYIFIKPRSGEPGEDASIEGIGGRRKYDYKVRDQPVARGPAGRGERKRSPPSGREPPARRRSPGGREGPHSFR